MNKITHIRIVLLSIFILLLILPGVPAQDDLIEKLSNANVDQIETVYAIDGNMVGPSNDIKYFVFGVVRLHKTGAPETEWSKPVFFFELDGKAVLGGTAAYHYFLEENENGTLNHLPALRELSSHTEEFELDFVFTKTGELDVSKSSVSLVPQQYASGREITQKAWTGEYYKKGSKTERFVPIRDKEGKVINQNEAGELVIEERSVRVLDVCYEAIIGKDIYYLRANLDNLTYHNSTGLCPVYKIQSISRSAGLPDAYNLGLIKSDKLLPPSSAEIIEIKKEPEKQQQIEPLSEFIIQDEEAKEPTSSNESGYITPVVVSPPTGKSLNVTHPPSNKSK